MLLDKGFDLFPGLAAQLAPFLDLGNQHAVVGYRAPEGRGGHPGNAQKGVNPGDKVVIDVRIFRHGVTDYLTDLSVMQAENSDLGFRYL